MADIRGYKWAAFCGLVAIVAMIPTAAGLIFGFAAAFMLFLLLGIPFAALLVWYARWRESDGEREWRTYIEERRTAKKVARAVSAATPSQDVQPVTQPQPRSEEGDIPMLKALGGFFTIAGALSYAILFVLFAAMLFPGVRSAQIAIFGGTFAHVVQTYLAPLLLAHGLFNIFGALFGPLSLRGLDRYSSRLGTLGFIVLSVVVYASNDVRTGLEDWLGWAILGPPSLPILHHTSLPT